LGVSEVAIDPKRLKAMGLVHPDDLRSRLAEEMRLIKRQLIQKILRSGERNGAASTGAHVVMVTSAVPGEGKSFIALNLALTFAADEQFDVLLVDADAMRPNILKMLGLSAERGLSNLLIDPSLSLADVMLRDPIMKLSLLPAGGSVPSATDLYGGPRMKELVASLGRGRPNRIVILDSPPVLATTEPIVLAHVVDEVLMVVEANRTSHSVVQSALDLLERCDNVNLVLNKSIASRSSEQFGSYYSTGTTGKGRTVRPGVPPP
jgi:receptor protein-tyrosine kinase